MTTARFPSSISASGSMTKHLIRYSGVSKRMESVPRIPVRRPEDMQVNTQYGGRMVYWNEPDGHQWEMLTVSYARPAK